MKNDTKFLAIFSLSTLIFTTPSIADESAKTVLKGLQLNGSFQVMDETTGAFNQYEIAVISQQFNVDPMNPIFPMGPIMPVPTRPNLNIGLNEGTDFFPNINQLDGVYQFPFSYLGLVGIQDGLVVKITLVDYSTIDGGTLVWDTPANYSALTGLDNGGYSLHLNDCPAVSDAATSCSEYTVDWMPNGNIDVKHSASLEEKSFGANIKFTSMNSIKTADIQATVNGVASTTGLNVFAFNGIYKFKSTSQIITDEMED